MVVVGPDLLGFRGEEGVAPTFHSVARKSDFGAISHPDGEVGRAAFAGAVAVKAVVLDVGASLKQDTRNAASRKIVVGDVIEIGKEKFRVTLK